MRGLDWMELPPGGVDEGAGNDEQRPSDGESNHRPREEARGRGRSLPALEESQADDGADHRAHKEAAAKEENSRVGREQPRLRRLVSERSSSQCPNRCGAPLMRMR